MTDQTETKSHLYKNCLEEVSALIQAQVPIIYVVTHEEDRFMRELNEEFVQPNEKEYWTWSANQGLIKFNKLRAEAKPDTKEQKTEKPQLALQKIVDQECEKGHPGRIYLMRDFHTVLVEPILRQIRDIYIHLQQTGKTLIITAPLIAHGPGGQKSGLPPTLEKQIHVVRYGLPTFDEIRTFIAKSIEEMQAAYSTSKVHLNYSEDEITDFARACRGLTLDEIGNSLATSFTHMRQISLRKLISDKRSLIQKSEILEYIDDVVSMDDVGGLDQAKVFLERYSLANTDEAREYGVEPLKGILLTGVPGTGKSLLAKAIGGLWKSPLLRLDVGRVMTGLVGGSEGKMREVIAQAEAMAPCILWIDEVEKSLAGTKSSNFSDGGTLARVFGTLLTAMQDGLKGVTIIATANDISLLPPEFIRRFNEVFFVDMPGPDERWEILSIHMQKRNRDIATFESNKDKILKACNDYTGAEIEKAVKDAVAAAFYKQREDVTVDDILDALNDTKPISVVMAEKVETMREKARGQYRFASSYAEQQSQLTNVKTSSGKELNLDEAMDDMAELVKGDKKEKKKSKNQKENGRFRNLS